MNQTDEMFRLNDELEKAKARIHYLEMGPLFSNRMKIERLAPATAPNGASVSFGWQVGWVADQLEEARLDLAAFRFAPEGAINAEWAPEPSRTFSTWGRGATHPDFGVAVIPGQMRYGKIVCEWRIYKKGDIDRTGGCDTPRQAMRAAEEELRKRGLL